RAARALGEAFLRQAGGKPMLLPRIAALGALDEAPLALAGALDLPPAVDEAQRLAVLARLVMALDGAYGAPSTADGAWRLARELADLLDEAHRAEVDLGEKLPAAAEAGYAEHWARTIKFLEIVTKAWPAWLEENGLMDGTARALALLDVQAATWDAEPPPYPVVVAGTTGGVPAVARLMRVVVRLASGSVILPGLDLDMEDDVWAGLEDGHPQAGMQHLLARMGAARGDVQLLPAPALSTGSDAGRPATLWRALLPADALSRWRDPFTPRIDGLHRLEPADQQEEAVAVSLALREALEHPHARAALVTPDRQLAVRVAAELARYGVIVDDSAGEALADTPPAAFLRLLARAGADGLAPVALLSVLKHPLAAFGLSTAGCRRAARRLERLVLRGPAPPPGIAGLRAALTRARHDPAAADLVDRLEARLAPILAIADRSDATPAEALQALLETAEAAAETIADSGAGRLWSREEGEALATHLATLQRALPALPPQPVATLPGLLEASMEGAVVRSRRALRGRDGVEHPRVVILGLLEARLQSFDVVVLGGLAEGVWPAATDPGPWMSRPMRTAVGLTSPEERVGQMAHDFALLACAAPTVILSCPRRREGAPAVPARWLVRLEAFLAGHGTALPHHPAAHWAGLLDHPDGDPRPAAPPHPRPPIDVRPRKLSVTEIETWLRDPYAIYARHILRLRALEPLEQNADAADYGVIVHKAVASWTAALPATYPADAARLLRAEMDRALAERSLRPALEAWWRPRLGRIADWLAELERQRRMASPRAQVAVEVAGDWRLPDRSFTLTGVADRIERRVDGTLALLDFKTGIVPQRKDVEAGYASQLLLEAAMAAAGAFGPELAGEAGELAYWRLTGGFVAGEVHELYKKDRASIPLRVADAARSLLALIEDFDRPARAYLSQPHPGAAPRFSDYGQLARVAEWAVLEDDA
ncbi:MAG: double-strand break repair protein AddB, partial [Acetobacteraceae bacterium]|nr:double-strand break repair protein AddB [Acetobacteraceae bacterium]